MTESQAIAWAQNKVPGDTWNSAVQEGVYGSDGSGPTTTWVVSGTHAINGELNEPVIIIVK